jgi:hypothetical protein
MKPGIAISRPQRVSTRWTTRLTEFVLDQLGHQPVFLDIDIIPGVWTSRRTSRCQHWEGNQNTQVLSE